ncbi:MAG: type IV pilus modification protein PilV [Ramlibacter sp.]|nr:type IV pilus modification protein PilV [Ramlibacter sp.]
MIEVLVTIIIIAFGLLGMAGLQVRMQASEFEAYQRSQALLLLEDMASRIAVNRNNAASYVTGNTAPIGRPEQDCSTLSSTSTVQRDLKEWCNALQGASETAGTGTAAEKNRGAMVGGRGCIESVGGDYMVTVAWQGLTPITAPPSSVACGINNYDGPSGAACSSDKCRRTVTTVVRIATL